MSNFGLEDTRIAAKLYLDNIAACTDLAVDDLTVDIDTLDDRLSRVRETDQDVRALSSWNTASHPSFLTEAREHAFVELRSIFDGLIELGGTNG